MKPVTRFQKTTLALAATATITMGLVACGGSEEETGLKWMRASIVARQAAATHARRGRMLPPPAHVAVWLLDRLHPEPAGRQSPDDPRA